MQMKFNPTHFASDLRNNSGMAETPRNESEGWPAIACYGEVDCPPLGFVALF